MTLALNCYAFSYDTAYLAKKNIQLNKWNLTTKRTQRYFYLWIYIPIYRYKCISILPQLCRHVYLGLKVNCSPQNNMQKKSKHTSNYSHTYFFLLFFSATQSSSSPHNTHLNTDVMINLKENVKNVKKYLKILKTVYV